MVGSLMDELSPNGMIGRGNYLYQFRSCFPAHGKIEVAAVQISWV